MRRYRKLPQSADYDLCERCHADLTSLPSEDNGEFEALRAEPSPQLQVDGLPDHLIAWEIGGRRAFDFLEDDLYPPDATEVLLHINCHAMPRSALACYAYRYAMLCNQVSLRNFGGAALPGWLWRHAALQTLDLSGCSSLAGLPARHLTRTTSCVASLHRACTAGGYRPSWAS
jgi:hypothetical protein